MNSSQDIPGRWWIRQKHTECFGSYKQATILLTTTFWYYLVLVFWTSCKQFLHGCFTRCRNLWGSVRSGDHQWGRDTRHQRASARNEWKQRDTMRQEQCCNGKCLLQGSSQRLLDGLSSLFFLVLLLLSFVSTRTERLASLSEPRLVDVLIVVLRDWTSVPWGNWDIQGG